MVWFVTAYSSVQPGSELSFAGAPSTNTGSCHAAAASPTVIGDAKNLTRPRIRSMCVRKTSRLARPSRASTACPDQG